MKIYYSVEENNGKLFASINKSISMRGFSIFFRIRKKKYFILISWENFEIRKILPNNEIKCGSYYGGKK